MTQKEKHLVDGLAHSHDRRRLRQWIRLVCGLLLLHPGIGAAQQPQKWTLAQCLERALEISPELHTTLADLQIAKSQLAQAKAGRLPQVTATSLSGIVRGTEGEGFEARTDDDDLGPFFKGELKVVQPLYTFGRLRHEIRAARQGVATRQAASAETRQAIRFRVKRLYHNLLFSRQIKDLLVEVQENFTKALETAEARLEAQEPNITQQDVLKLRIGLAGVSKELITLDRATAVTLDALKRELGLQPEAPFDIADTRLQPVRVRLQALDVYLQQAAQYRPELRQIEAGLAAQKARLQAARSAYYPTFFLAGGIRGAVAPNREDQKSPFVKDDFNFLDIGGALGMRWRLDVWVTHAKVAERIAEVSKVEFQQQSARTGVDLDVRRRYLEVQENQRKLAAAQKARRAARALTVTSLANFTLGIGEAKEVFTNLGLYTRMASDYYTVIRDLNLAVARLSQAIGQDVIAAAASR